MAAGVPVVATAVGGVPDVVRHNETGWLVASGDTAGLADAVKLAIYDGDRLAARARQEVLGKYSKERLVKDIEELYESLSKAQLSRHKAQL